MDDYELHNKYKKAIKIIKKFLRSGGVSYKGSPPKNEEELKELIKEFLYLYDYLIEISPYKELPKEELIFLGDCTEDPIWRIHISLYKT